MSRNDQVKRQWYLLRKLESSRGATLEELVVSLPPDHACHVRTVRRDLDALTSDFPLYTERVDGQTRWRLVEGFTAPALAFSPGAHVAGIQPRFDEAARRNPHQGFAGRRVGQSYVSVAS